MHSAPTDFDFIIGQWEQAFSSDAGLNWETNWTMEFERAEAWPFIKETQMTAAGPFEVKLTPQPPAEDAAIGRLTLDKMEQVTGTLHGKQGTFVLQHSGVMTRGEGQLAVSVVPDSGTGDLAGLSGTMNIVIAGGKHSYIFDYTIPNAHSFAHDRSGPGA